MNQLRFGILGTAQIARKNWKAIWNTGNAVVTAVASRDIARSRKFIEECQQQAPFPTPPRASGSLEDLAHWRTEGQDPAPPRAFGSYEELLASPDVDAVYVPLPTGIRKEWVIRAAQAGKHVVCEKPCARNAADLREMIAACRQHNVQFMDGVMFMHSRRLGRVRESLDDGTSIGGIKRITAAFSFCGDDAFLRNNIRAQDSLEPAGCLGDLGWYCIRIILWAMNWQIPREVSGRMLSHAGAAGATAVPTEFSAELFFGGGVSAAFYCSFLTENQQWATISGTKGHLHISDFVLPFKGPESSFEIRAARFEMNGCDFEMTPVHERISVHESGNSDTTAQETSLFRNFTDQVRSGKLNAQWPAIALQTQGVMDACLESARAGRPLLLEKDAR